MTTWENQLQDLLAGGGGTTRTKWAVEVIAVNPHRPTKLIGDKIFLGYGKAAENKARWTPANVWHGWIPVRQDTTTFPDGTVIYQPWTPVLAHTPAEPTRRGQQTCVTCSGPFVFAAQVDGALMRLDPTPDESGEVFAVGNLLDIPTALFGDDRTPRYNRHKCAVPDA